MEFPYAQKSFFLFQVPDIAVIVIDRTVTGEETGTGDVHEHHACPLSAVVVVICRGFLGGAVALKIKQGHEPVLVLEVVLEITKHVVITNPAHRLGSNEVDRVADAFGTVVEVD